MKYSFLFVTMAFLLSITNINAQSKSEEMMDKVPYAEIPEDPTTFTSGNLFGRMIDGLGFRYYWATDSLRAMDLDYKISEDSRSCGETLDHLHGLSKFILSVAVSDPSIRDQKDGDVEWETLRKQTLNNFKRASEAVKLLDEEGVSQLKIVFTRGDKVTEYPMWNVINGPVSDAIYHVGQIVAFRRAAGNPMHPGVSVFSGRNRG